MLVLVTVGSTLVDSHEGTPDPSWMQQALVSARSARVATPGALSIHVGEQRIRPDDYPNSPTGLANLLAAVERGLVA